MGPKDIEEIGTIELQAAMPFLEECATMKDAVELAALARHPEEER